MPGKLTPDEGTEHVTINGRLYEVIEWDWRDSGNEGEEEWVLYARKVEDETERDDAPAALSEKNEDPRD
jgi:hypothetical protein